MTVLVFTISVAVLHRHGFVARVRVTVFFTVQQSQTTQLHAQSPAVAVTTIGSRVTVRVTEASTGKQNPLNITPNIARLNLVIIFLSCKSYFRSFTIISQRIQCALVFAYGKNGCTQLIFAPHRDVVPQLCHARPSGVRCRSQYTA